MSCLCRERLDSKSVLKHGLFRNLTSKALSSYTLPRKLIDNKQYKPFHDKVTFQTQTSDLINVPLAVSNIQTQTSPLINVANIQTQTSDLQGQELGQNTGQNIEQENDQDEPNAQGEPEIKRRVGS